MQLLIIVVVLTTLIYVVANYLFRQVTVFEFERRLRYRQGRFDGVVGPGTYWIAPRWRAITKVDIRPAFLAVPGQEVVTLDGVGLKVTISAQYQIADPARVSNAGSEE